MKKKLLIVVWKYWQFCTFLVFFLLLKLLSVFPNSDLILALPYTAFIFCFCYFVFYRGLKDLDFDGQKVTTRNRMYFFAKFVGCWILVGAQVEYFLNIRNGLSVDLLAVDQIAVLMYLFIGMFFVKFFKVGNHGYSPGEGLNWVMYPIWYLMGVMYPMLFLRWLIETFGN